MTAAVIDNQKVLIHCAILQTLDIATTLLFLPRGVAEANPFVKWSIGMAHGNLAGLLAVKSLACVLALLAVRSGRTRAVAKMNCFFSFLVVWNLVALALNSRLHG